MTVRRPATALACLALAACAAAAPGGLFDDGPRVSEALDFDTVIADPGVYAGREITLVGLLTETRGQACLTDRGRAVAVRLIPRQAAALSGAQERLVTIRGTFRQNLCPAGYVCPEYCAPFGLDEADIDFGG